MDGRPVTNAALEQEVLGALCRYTSEFTARGIVRRANQRSGASLRQGQSFADVILFGAKLFVEEPQRGRLVGELSRLFGQEIGKPLTVNLPITDEYSARRARVLVRSMAADAGATRLAALRVATALSELARNIVLYAGQGQIKIETLQDPARIRVTAADQGPGISDLEQVMSGEYQSRTGLGRGLRGTKRLSDVFNIETGPSGTRVEIELTL